MTKQGPFVALCVVSLLSVGGAALEVIVDEEIPDAGCAVFGPYSAGTYTVEYLLSFTGGGDLPSADPIVPTADSSAEEASAEEASTEEASAEEASVAAMVAAESAEPSLFGVIFAYASNVSTNASGCYVVEALTELTLSEVKSVANLTAVTFIFDEDFVVVLRNKGASNATAAGVIDIRTPTVLDLIKSWIYYVIGVVGAALIGAVVIIARRCVQNHRKYLQQARPAVTKLRTF